MIENKENLLWINHQNGKLGYYTDSNGDAVLCDYRGDAAVLILPSLLNVGTSSIGVSGIIPDEAFGSCENVQLIIADCDQLKWDLGYFLFKNCTKLKGIIALKRYWNDDDYGPKISDTNGYVNCYDLSFVRRDLAPKHIQHLDMNIDYDNYHFEKIENFAREISDTNSEDMLLNVLRYINERGYYGPYAEITLEKYANAKTIQDCMQKGFDATAMNTIGECWKRASEQVK